MWSYINLLCWPVSAMTDLGAEIILIFSNPACLTCSSRSASVKVCCSDAWPASLVSLRKPRHTAKINQQAVRGAVIQCPHCKHWRTSIPHHLMKIINLLQLQDFFSLALECSNAWHGVYTVLFKQIFIYMSLCYGNNIFYLFIQDHVILCIIRQRALRPCEIVYKKNKK